MPEAEEEWPDTDTKVIDDGCSVKGQGGTTYHIKSKRLENDAGGKVLETRVFQTERRSSVASVRLHVMNIWSGDETTDQETGKTAREECCPALEVDVGGRVEQVLIDTVHKHPQ